LSQHEAFVLSGTHLEDESPTTYTRRPLGQ
jgi:hypothetical protein